MVLFILLIVCASVGVFGKMPSIKDLQNPDADLASEVYSEDGVLMGKYYTENRSEVRYNQISPFVINALIATEDMRFYDHSGIDAKRLGKAIVTFGTNGGGSTITQQLAKMIMKQGDGNFIERSVDKLKEWIVAVKLERNFTKEEIITLYLNRAPWAGNIYGIRNASLAYFNKEPGNLSLEEAAVLVGMLRGNIYNPVRFPGAGLIRRNTVINRMAECDQHFITREEAEKYKSKALVTSYKKPDEYSGIAPYFRDAVKDTLLAWCKAHINPRTGEPYDLYRDGLKIRTTINSVMQLDAELAVEKHMPVIQSKLDAELKQTAAQLWKGHEYTINRAMKGSERWKNMEEDGTDSISIMQSFSVPVKMKVFAWNAAHEKDTVMTPLDSIKYHKQFLQTSFVCMDPASGAVKCWVGGINHKWFKLDHVNTSRQVGSAIKPLLYTLAIKDLDYKAGTIIPGGPVTLNGKTITGTAGTLAQGLAFSINHTAFSLIQQTGTDKFVEFLHNCGIRVDIPSVPSIALGAVDIPILQLLQAYTMFPGRGLNSSPVYITRIEDKNGKVLEEFSNVRKELISEGDAYTAVQLMMGVVRSGTAKSLNNYGIPVEIAGKTGTTNNNTDGWFVGYTPELLAGTWVGCSENFITISKYGTSGGNEMALPNWGNFMKKVYADRRLPYGKQNRFRLPADSLSFLMTPNLLDSLAKPADSLMESTDNNNPDSNGYFNNESPLNNIPPQKQDSLNIKNPARKPD